jgi:hypothetical protein
VNDPTTPPAHPRRAVRVRFVCWQLVILVWWLAGAWWLFGGARAWTGWHVLNACAIATAILLSTTPPDAIRLPRERSDRLIAIGIAWFWLWAFFAAEASLLRLATTGLVMIVVWYASRRILARYALSPWWSALWLWHPLALAQLC